MEFGATLVGARTGFDEEFDAVDAARFAGDFLKLDQVEDDERGGRARSIGRRRDDAGDGERAHGFVDDQVDVRGQGIGEVVTNPYLWAGVDGFPETAVVAFGTARIDGLVEKGFVLRAREVGDREQIDAEQRVARASEFVFVARRRRRRSGDLDDGNDMDGPTGERGAQLGQDTLGEGAGGRLNAPVALTGEGFGEVGETRDGGTVGETHGDEHGHAERQNEDEESALFRCQPPVAQRETAQEKRCKRRAHQG